MSAIGILGGMGPQASSRLYELLIEGTKALNPAAVDEDFPAIVLLNVPVPNFVSNTKNLAITKTMLIKGTKILEESGCTINGIACNTAHILMPELQATTSVPFLSIPDLVANKIQKLGFKRVGLLATPTTLKSRLYDDAMSGKTNLIRPNQQTSKVIEKFIYKQLNSDISLADTRELRLLVKSFMSAKNLDAVILGCTELPLVFGSPDDDSVIDTLKVLSDGLLNNYFKKLA
jgi:aspartate racemase